MKHGGGVVVECELVRSKAGTWPQCIGHLPIPACLEHNYNVVSKLTKTFPDRMSGQVFNGVGCATKIAMSAVAGIAVADLEKRNTKAEEGYRDSLKYCMFVGKVSYTQTIQSNKNFVKYLWSTTKPPELHKKQSD
jgi:hypothetical protein